MYKLRIFSTVLSASLAILMVLMLAACGGQGGSKEQTAQTTQATVQGSTAATEVKKEPVKLRILIGGETGLKWNSFPDNGVAKEIERVTGVSIEFIESDETKFKTLLAAGDLPDMLRTDQGKFGKSLIEGKQIIPLDDLLAANGQDILKNAPTMIDASKKLWSQGQNKVYFIKPMTSQVPQIIDKVFMSAALFRWDYYKEIGAPAINTPDDLLNAVAAIVAKHPTTEDGKKVYGISFWNDWGWPYFLFSYPFDGDQFRKAGEYNTAKVDSTELKNVFTDEESGYWTSTKLFYKANKMGLLDPDLFINKFDDYKAKTTSGQIVFEVGNFADSDYNAKYAQDGKGFVAVPAGKYAWGGDIQPLGWTSKDYCVSSSCKTPDRAMDLLNYLYSIDGAMTLWNGVKGVDWDIVDGKPKLKDATVAGFKAKDDTWFKTGIQIDTNFIGISGATLNSEYGVPINLFVGADMLANSMNATEKAMSEYYGADYTGQVFDKLIKEGKMVNLSGQTGNSQVVIPDNLISASVAALPDDINKIQAKLTDIMTKSTPKMVLAKSDDQFNAAKKQMMDEMKAVGIDAYIEWGQKAWNEAKAVVGAK